MTEKIKKAGWTDWEAVGLLGRGSFGSVYEIQRCIGGKTERAAMKIISIPRTEEELEEKKNDGYNEESLTTFYKQYLDTILEEYSIMRELNGHANIVSCEDVKAIQHEDGVGWDIFIKMELLTPLSKNKVSELSEDEIIKLGIDICSALELCKAHNIIHRDIKPQNIFISSYGNYKLGDFGIAKTAEKTMVGTIAGSPDFMSPEVYNNKPYGFSADMYSLGLVLYWWLNERRLPFLPLPPQFPTPLMLDNARKRRFSGEEIPEPKNGSEELKSIVLKACAFDEGDRFEDISQMKAALLELEKTLGKPDDPPKGPDDPPKGPDDPPKGPVDPPKGPVDPPKNLIAIVIAVALIIGGAIGGYMLHKNRDNNASNILISDSTISGDLNNADDILELIYKAEKTSAYYFFFSISDPLADYSFEVISHSTGQSRGVKYYSDEGDFAVINLTGGNTYTVKVAYKDKPCSFTIKICEASCDVQLDGTEISGKIDYSGKTNVYHYNVPISGYYRFDFEASENDKDFDIEIISESTGNVKLKRSYSEDIPSAEVLLTKDHTYTIKISYNGDFCDYGIKITAPENNS